MTTQPPVKQLALWVRNEDREDLEKRKVYQAVPDQQAAREGHIRVLDESGENYLDHESYFVPIQLPREAENALRTSSRFEVYPTTFTCAGLAEAAEASRRVNE